MLNEQAEFDPVAHAQVAKLLGAGRASTLLGLLRQSMSKFAEMTPEQMVSPAGMAHIHRLKSESGLMGFVRLSLACGAVDTSSVRGIVAPTALADLCEALGSAMKIADEQSVPTKIKNSW